MKLVKNETYLLLIDEEAEINIKDWFLNLSHKVGTEECSIITDTIVAQRLISKKNPELFLSDGFINGVYEDIHFQRIQGNFELKYCQKVLAYYPLKEAKELDLPLLPNPFEEVEELAIKHLKVVFTDNSIAVDNIFDVLQDDNKRNVYKSFISGYLAAQSKQFSLEDMKKACIMAKETVEEGGKELAKYSVLSFLQSLSTQQLPKGFIPEYEDRIALDGHTIVGKELKTITNSEGKQEIQGTYKY